jgi:phosphatidylglycerol:prolipoprotein diacylglycerol transferase
MHPVLFRWGTYTLYSYSALVCLGILLGVLYAHWRSRRAGFRDTAVLDGALWTLLGGLVGARVAYVIPNWLDYAGRPASLIGFWGGGLVFQGGLIGGSLALLLYSHNAQLPFLSLVDLAAPAVSIAQSLGWVGAFSHGANYGLIVRSPLSVWLPDLYGIHGPRFPVQILASLLGLLLFLGLHRLSERELQPGTLGLVYLLGNGAGHFLLEFTRADEAPYLGLLRVTQVAELAEILVAGALLLYLWVRRRAKVPRLDVTEAPPSSGRGKEIGYAETQSRPGTDQPDPG